MYKDDGDGVPRQKKHSLKEFAVINARVLAKEIKNGTKNIKKNKKKSEN